MKSSDGTSGQLNRWDALSALVLVFLCILVFLPSVPYEFINWDDEKYIHRNPWLLAMHLDNIVGVFRHSYFSNYHPLTMLSYMVDFQFFGYEAPGYRAVNIVLHSLTVGCAFLMLRSLRIVRSVAFALVLFFAVHPLRLESVVWISERKDVLCGFFYVLAAWCWILQPRTKRGGRLAIAGALVFMILSLLAKAMAVSLPFVFLLYDTTMRREKLKSHISVLILAFLASGLFMYLNTVAQTMAIAEESPIAERLKVALFAPLFYTWKTIFPAGISALYPWEFRPTRSIAAPLAGLVYAVALLAVVACCWRRHPLVSFGLLSAAVILGPVSGIVSFGSAFAADRYSYLPTLFLFVACGHALGLIVKDDRKSHVIVYIGGMIVAGALAFQLYRLMPSWQNSAATWERVLLVYPDSTIARLNVSHGRLSGGAPEAIRSEAAGIADQYETLNEARALEAFTLMKEERYDEALTAARRIADRELSLQWQISVYQRMDDWESGVDAARELVQMGSEASPETRAQAGLVLARTHHFDEALAVMESLDQPTMRGAFVWGILAQQANAEGDAAEMKRRARRALRIYPAESQSMRLLAAGLIEEGDLAGARQVYRQTARHPAAQQTVRTDAWLGVAEIARRSGDSPDTYVDRAFDLEDWDSANADDYNYIGFMAEQNNRIELAISLYKRALEINPRHYDAQINLAYVYLRSDDREKALETLRIALKGYPGDETILHNIAQLEAMEAPVGP